MSQLLIVDDEADVREFAKNFFSKRKIECATAESGELALESIKQSRPSLVLLDMRMGGIDGMETLSRIREFDKDLKVVMVTGVDDRITIERAKSLGVLAYIHKPLVLEELEAVVLKEINR